MLAIRMQRTGRKAHAMFRVVVQDSRRTPTSGKVVALIGSYDPHTKTVNLQKDKAAYYLEHGAQPSDRVVKLFVTEGVELPKWVTMSEAKNRATRTPDKLRKNRPAPEVTDQKPAESEEETLAKAEAKAETATGVETSEDTDASSESNVVSEAKPDAES